ncbi:hypothetical protein NZL82_03825 [Sphingomonas sanguinis]|uniref:hypothetical protein n=1 Tax=Sphingomonas sp. LC-1 TaxID=3110957 RepID=UPI0021BA4085|nr:hypothetical protein [Sphingomonas sp. LC-1]MCT8001004.1 hypothetical protein [Sphingomonas sp. LC-1]
MIFSLILAAAAPASIPIPAGLAPYVRDHKLTRYDHALRDLNDDGRPEALVYARPIKGSEQGTTVINAE